MPNAAGSGGARRSRKLTRCSSATSRRQPRPPSGRSSMMSIGRLAGGPWLPCQLRASCTLSWCGPQTILPLHNNTLLVLRRLGMHFTKLPLPRLSPRKHAVTSGCQREKRELNIVGSALLYRPLHILVVVVQTCMDKSRSLRCRQRYWRTRERSGSLLRRSRPVWCRPQTAQRGLEPSSPLAQQTWQGRRGWTSEGLA